jgi:hypothetical protein
LQPTKLEKHLLISLQHVIKYHCKARFRKLYLSCRYTVSSLVLWLIPCGNLHPFLIPFSICTVVNFWILYIVRSSWVSVWWFKLRNVMEYHTGGKYAHTEWFKAFIRIQKFQTMKYETSRCDKQRNTKIYEKITSILNSWRHHWMLTDMEETVARMEDHLHCWLASITWADDVIWEAKTKMKRLKATSRSRGKGLEGV